MPYKDPLKQKKAQHESYLRNKDRIIEKTKLTRIKRKKYIQNIKKKNCCKKCGFSDYRALVFHHRNPEEKKYVVAEMAHRTFSIEKIDKEIAKCDILCANCHNILHHGRVV